MSLERDPLGRDGELPDLGLVQAGSGLEHGQSASHLGLVAQVLQDAQVRHRQLDVAALADEVARFLEQVPVAEGLAAKLNRLLLGFLEAEVLPPAMRAAELGPTRRRGWRSSRPCFGCMPTRSSAPSVTTAERVATPGVDPLLGP